MEAVVAECVSFTLKKLCAVAADEINLLRGFREERANLENYLKTVERTLEDAATHEIDEDDVKSWLKDLEDAAYDADNVLDDIKYEELRRKIKTQDEIKPKRCLNIPCCPNTTLTFQREMGHKIKDINAKFKIILGRHRVKDHPRAKLQIEETTSVGVGPPLIGRESDESKILEMITSSINNDLSVLPIVGMGGLGKTALARKIFSHPYTKSHFERWIWVCASEIFDEMTLYKRILQILTLNKYFDENNEEAVLRKIAEELKQKRYLIVLDDLWSEITNYWDDSIKDKLEGVSSSKGNVIIVTTRNEKVASTVKTFSSSDCPYSLSSLKDDQCWSIIRARAFQDIEVPNEFENTWEEIAGKCRGIPLAANVVGNVLRGKRAEDWLIVLQNGLSNLEEICKEKEVRGVLQILKLSYNRLPSSMKKCFAYCSLFVKDSVINKIDLIQLWMAEGFLRNHSASDMETIGDAFFNDFFRTFFFQEPKMDEHGNIMSCKMHDFFHDLACLVSKSDDTFQVRHLATTSIGEGTSINRLRMLSSTSSVPDKIWRHLKHLHVLKLSGAAIEELPNSIKKLKRLRYLDVSDNVNLTTLPESVCKLFFLQTLRIHDFVSWLPEDLRFLIHLRHLCFVNVGNREMPPEIGRLSDLQTLPSFYVRDKEGCRIDELGKLKNLRGKLQIHNLELVKERTEAKEADMAGKKKIYELHFQWGSRDGFIESEIIDENVLEGLQPHEDLKILTVEGFQGKKFPLWTINMKINKDNSGFSVKLGKLIKIEFTNCHKCEEIPMLGHLPHLKYLRLYDLASVTSIGSSFYGGSDCSSISSNDGQVTIVSFPSLRSLTIEKMPNLTKWEEAPCQIQVFCCLEYLKLSECENLTHVPHLRGSGASIQHLEVYDCHNLTFSISQLSEMGCLNSLRELYVGGSSNSMHFDSFQNSLDGIELMKSLEKLHLYGQGNWVSLPDRVRYLTSLKELEINGFGMERLPDWFGNLSCLDVLSLWHCDKLRHLPSKEVMLQLTKLTKLKIVSCRLLGDRCRPESSPNSEWPKISHIPHVEIPVSIVQL